jgi:hypothetical protein
MKWKANAAWAWIALAMGCSSEAGDAPQGPAGPFVPAGDGVLQSEAEACEAITDALAAQASKLGCATTFVACPNYLRKIAPTHDCRDWDRGSVQGCVAYVQGYASCDDFSGKPFAPTFATSRSMCADGDAGGP